jgi:hypothetical protein
MFMRKRFIKNSVIAVLLATTLMTPLVSGVIGTAKVYATGTTTTPTTPTTSADDEEESSTDANNTTTNNNTSSGGTTAQYNDPNFSFYRTSIFGRQFLNAWAYVARQGRQDGGTTGVGTGSGGADGNGAEVSSDPSADVVSAVKNLKDKFKFDEDSTMYVNTTNAGATSSSTGMGLNGGFTGAFFSGNANPDSIKREGDIFGGELTDAMKMVDGSIGGAGSSNTEWTFTYKDMNLPLKNNGRGSSFVIDGSPYGYYGAALNTMGYDNVSANFSKNPTGFAALARIGGFVFFWELKLMRITNSMFSITAKVLQSLNPFSVFNDMDKDSPILSDEQMTTNLYAQFTDKFTGFLGGVRLFSLTIMAFIIVFGLARAYMSERGSLGQFFKSMGIRLAFTGFAFSAVMMSTTYLLDLTSNMYSKVGGMNDTMTDDVFSTYVDFEAWMKSSRLALPHGTRIIWNTHSNSVDAISLGSGVSNMGTKLALNRVNRTIARFERWDHATGKYKSTIDMYKKRRAELQAQLNSSNNVGSNNAAELGVRYSDLAMLINQNSYYNTIENRSLMGSGSGSLGESYNVLYAMKNGQNLATIDDDNLALTDTEKSQIDLNDSLVDSIFARYLNNAKFDPGAYESYIKSGKDFQKYINGENVKAVNWQVEQKELQKDPSLFGKMKAGENLSDSDAFKKIPMISMLYSVDSDAGIFVSTVDTKKGLIGIESKTGDSGIIPVGSEDLITLSDIDGDGKDLLQKNFKDGTSLYHSGMPMSVITAYNYLSSSFGPTSLTYTNPSNLNTTYAKGSHASVTMPGDMSNALSLVKSLVKYGAMILVIFIFSASLMLSTFKAGLAIFTQAPLALSGFITFIVKFLVACIMMIVSIVITIFFYFISFNIIDILSGTGLRMLLGGITINNIGRTLLGNRPGVLNVADIIAIALMVFFVKAVLDYRGKVIEAIDLLLESALNQTLGAITVQRGSDLGLGSSTTSIDKGIMGFGKNVGMLGAGAAGALATVAKKHPALLASGAMLGGPMLSGMAGNALKDMFGGNGANINDLADKGKTAFDKGIDTTPDKNGDNSMANAFSTPDDGNKLMAGLHAGNNEQNNIRAFRPNNNVGGMNKQADNKDDKQTSMPKMAMGAVSPINALNMSNTFPVDSTTGATGTHLGHKQSSNNLAIDKGMIDSNNVGYTKDGYDYSGYKNGVDRQGYNTSGMKADANGNMVDKQGHTSSIPEYSEYNDSLVKPYTDPNTLKSYSGIPADPVTGNTAKMDAQGYTASANGMPGFKRDDTGTWRDRAGFDLHGLDKDGVGRDGYAYDVGKNGNLIRGAKVYDSTGFKTTANGDKVDRNGFNQYGYKADSTGTMRDVNGADRTGRDSVGNQLYNEHGYTKDGYNKFGYDANGFNRDGFNAQGFDRQGYDANGFNAQGEGKYPWMGSVANSPMMMGGVNTGTTGIYNNSSSSSNSATMNKDMNVNLGDNAFVDKSNKGFDGKFDMSENFANMSRIDANGNDSVHDLQADFNSGTGIRGVADVSSSIGSVSGNSRPVVGMKPINGLNGNGGIRPLNTLTRQDKPKR